MRKLPIKIILASIIAFVSVSSAYAQTIGIAEKAANLYQVSLGIGIVLALGIIVYGGVRYSMSAGNPSGIKDAKDWISAAFLGLFILFGAFLILNTINPNLTNLESILLATNLKQEESKPTFTLPPIKLLTIEEFRDTIISTEPAVTGTYSCVWNEGAAPGSKCQVAGDTCRGGFIAGNCTSRSGDQDFCESVEDLTCEWVGGTTYDAFAAVARGYAVPKPKVRGVNPVADIRHQEYVAAEPLSEKSTSYPDCLGADCGVFVSTVVRQTIDQNFPIRGTVIIRPYLETSPMYDLVIVSSSAELRPGDILMPSPTFCPTFADGTTRKCGTGHIAIWLDDGEYEAAYSSLPKQCGNGEYLPRAQGPWKPHMKSAFRYVGF